ncbi:hypothetical protein [Billgrantia kenyensis]|uniref:Uncharacterized protein n=1 Tax=Billgrantia kenyensis TaxID=321266 RepID=A0A7W0AG01_9GAMM|nr:hypothetical protein [Halomonas kenyensis]MBA2780896.1 hypothetical protein [Halomonas kenyensis]MCG6663643.1 hypothetical protein [Halomonas kenyensis]
MAQKSFDLLRALAIGSQALGFILIITLETVMGGEAARPWQGVTLAVMVAFALCLALARLYRRNKVRKAMARRLADDDDES